MAKKTWTGTIEVKANELLFRVKELIEAGNVRRLIIDTPNGKLRIEIPLTAGVAVGSVLTILAPYLTALGAMAALLAKVRIKIIREN